MNTKAPWPANGENSESQANIVACNFYGAEQSVLEELFIRPLILTFFVLFGIGTAIYGFDRKDDIKLIEKQIVTGASRVMANDAHWIETNMDPNARYIGYDGTILGRGELIDIFNKKFWHYDSLVYSQIDTRIFGDAAISTFKVVQRATFKGASVNGSFFCTYVFQKQGGSWKLVTGSESGWKDE